MANPRKFSEKIALHTQKQAEETAAFERIMREVSVATNKASSATRKPKVEVIEEQSSSSLRPTSQVGLGTFRSGSLPNVAAPPTATVHIVQIKPEEMNIGTQYTAASGGQLAGNSSPSRGPPMQRGRASSSVGPMRARPAERKHDTSPYGSSVYLSPPSDSSWRRTNSDSALHQSCGGGGDQAPAPVSLSPHHYTHTSHHQHHRRTMDNNNIDSMLAMLGASQNRPRSSCEMPRVPGVNVYESGGCGLVAGGGGLSGGDMQVPGGSLPDLTSVHYPEHVGHPSQHSPQHYPASPHRTTPEYHQRSPYHQSPTSPGAISPVGGGGLSPVGGGGVSPVSAGAGGSVSNALHAALHSEHPPPPYDTQNHLSVPNTNTYLHHNNQSMSPLEQSWIAAGYQAHCSPPSVHSSHSNINIPSPSMGGHSPGSPAESPQPDSYYISQALLQPFQQISMDWAQLVQSLVESGVTWTAQVQMDTPVSNYNTSYMNHSSPSPQSINSHHTYSQAPMRSSGDQRHERDTRTDRDPVAGGNGPLFPPVTSPATPASIPDIIFTDFSGELSMGKDLDGSLFGCEEDRLREGLDPVDLDGLTLLADPGSLLPDPSAEDVFRLDRL